MTNKSKKITSILLVLIMALGMLPAMTLPAFAAEDDVCHIGSKYYQDIESALLEFQSGQVLTLLKNAEINGTLNVGLAQESMVLVC